MNKKLRDVCRFYSGTGFPVAYQGKESGELPFYKVGDIANNVAVGNTYLYNCNNYISRNEASEIKGTIIPKGTVVFAKIGEALKLNRRAITACDCLVDNNAMGIAPNLDLLRENYFFYFMKKLKLQDFAESTTVPSVRKSKLEQIEIVIPSMEEQKRIEVILDKTAAIIQGRKKELQRLDDLIKARFVEMFGSVSTGEYNFPTVKLGEVAEVGSSHRVFTTEFVENGIPFYRGTEIGELANGEQPSKPYYISEQHYNRLANDETKPQWGDILLPSICNKGQVWMVDNDEPFYYKDGRVLSVRPNLCVFNPRYLQYLLKEKTLVEYPKMGSGSTFAEFKIFLLKDLDITVPPMVLQDDFDRFIQQVDKSKSVVQKSLDEAQLLFDSLMQQYFG